MPNGTLRGWRDAFLRKAWTLTYSALLVTFELLRRTESLRKPKSAKTG
jgi:hypothetical protein